MTISIIRFQITHENWPPSQPQCELSRKTPFSRVFVQAPAHHLIWKFSRKKNPLSNRHDLSMQKTTILTFWQKNIVNRYISILCFKNKLLVEYPSFSQCWKNVKKTFLVFFMKSALDEVKGFFFQKKNPLSNKHDFNTLSNVIHSCYFPATKIGQKVKGFFSSGVHPHTQSSILNVEFCKIVRSSCLQMRLPKSNWWEQWVS